jgi:diguanylate cyclase (GGDEF)-like protein/PAS domain S-box-containing protein
MNTNNEQCERILENNQALNDLFVIAAQPIELNLMLGQSLDRLLSLSWLSLLPRAGIFLTEQDEYGEPFLRLAVERNLGKQIPTLCAKVAFGHCLCGQVAQTKSPLHAVSVDERHHTTYPGMPPHGHYNIPILSDDSVLGVLVLYLPDGMPRDEEQLAFLNRAASVFSLAVKLRLKEQELQKTNRELRFQKAILDEHAIVSITDAHGKIIYANEKFCQISGYSQEELLDKNHNLVRSGVHPDAFYHELWATISSGKVWHGEIYNRNKDGSHYWSAATILPFLDEQGKPFRYVSARTDISERKQVENALKQAQSIARLGSWHLDLQSDQLTWSDEIYHIFGTDQGDFDNNFAAFLKIVHPDDLDNLKASYQASIEGDLPYNLEHRIIRQDNGEVRWVHEMCSHQRNAKGEVIRSDGIVQDITERKCVQNELQRLAMTDQLTGLANRNHFHARFEEHLKLCRREKQKLGLMLLDLDRFKPVNDTHGHLTGDAVLVRMAQIFSAHSRETDLVARLGGDEFAILLIHPEDNQSIEKIAQRIIASVSEPFAIDNHRIKIGTSIGIALFPDSGDNQDRIIQMADQALYSAKRSGRNTYRIQDTPTQEQASQNSDPPPDHAP